MNLDQVRTKVAAQRTALPALYGAMTFDFTPERFTEDPRQSVLKHRRARLEIKPSREQIELIRAYTLLGDSVADAYAALIPTYGVRRLIVLLQQACDDGLAAVPDAPRELVAFIREMEQVPDWLDMAQVREGARLERNGAANLAPFVIRGAFLATFLNKYSALPMALTGTLSHESAARRVRETASFFATTSLPDALERHGAGFKAAAMVRLMHSMVRFNALRSERWDVAVYGLPIPQVDQMPAGLIPVFLLAFKMLRQGRLEFTRAERAQVELSRYRCFLLGLPEDLLADTPQKIVELVTARNQTLRDGFDDATCGALIRATLAAYLPPDRSLPNQIFDAIERRFAKALFLSEFLAGDGERAEQMGVRVSPLDKLTYGLVGMFLQTRMAGYGLTQRVPGLRDVVDHRLVNKIQRHLARYGHPEFTTDASHYRASAQRPALV
ncbi:MAG: hypothetical protein RL701_3362 [Pseudomonadota bacterium]